jgi:hypothetical protein
MNRTAGTCFVLLVLFLLAAGLTAAAYLSLIIPEYRQDSFYVALVGSCVAEAVFFGYLAYAMSSSDAADASLTPTRLRGGFLVAIWLLVVLVTSGMAVLPRNADTLVADRLLVIQLGVSFLFFLGLVLLHRQTGAVQTRSQPVQRERVRLEAYAGGLDVLIDDLRQAVARFPDQVVEFDRLLKRFDTLKTQLLSSSGTALRDEGRPCETISMDQVEQSLRELKKQVQRLAGESDDTAAAILKDIRGAVDATLTLLKRREDVLSF